MIVKEFSGIDVKVYNEKLENGLDIYLIPFEDRKDYYIEYVTKYGANDVDFISSKTKKRVKLPYGIAHFLEHKMFEQESGVDPFSFYSESGTDSNASTSYDVTSYSLEGTKNIEKNLDFLLNFVNTPYFTNENVEKEKGIIIEELNMYKDLPENKLYAESNKALFKKHPIRNDIGGTPSSVRKITKEMLYECYETFYQPSNMFLVISGKFDIEKIMNVIKNNKILNQKKYSDKPKLFKVNEPEQVNLKEKKVKVNNIMIPKFLLTLKYLKKDLTKDEKCKYLMTIKIFFYILFGPSSSFRENIFKKELCTMFYVSNDFVDDIVIIEFMAETKKMLELKKLILNYLKEHKITREDVERVKKAKISLEVIDSDKPFRILNSVINHIVMYDDIIYNKIDLIRSITYEDVLKVKDDLILDNYSFVLALPKK